MSRDFASRALAAAHFGLLGAALLAALWTVPALRAAPAQRAGIAGPQVVDRIVVRIEDDIITLSEMRELAGYQQLVDGKTEPDDQILSELIEQWVVNSEATAAQFPAPADSEVDREVARIESHYTDSQGAPSSQSPSQTYAQRLAALEMTPETVRRMVQREIFLARYLDYKFRPSVQVDDAAVETYYNQELLPELAAKKQTAPPLDDVREQIREVLVQRGISQRASSWFDETKSRLNIEVEPAAGAAPVSAAHE
jgi:hypothetical protein